MSLRIKQILKESPLYPFLKFIRGFPEKVRFKFRGGYRNPKRYWERRGRTFADESYQQGIYAQHWWMLKHINTLRPKSIVEVGCGFGRNLRFLKENIEFPVEMAGFDFAKSMIENAKKNLAGFSDITLREGTFSDLPPEPYFDISLVHGVFMHIPLASLPEAIKRLSQTTKKAIIIVEEIRRDPNRIILEKSINDFTFSHNYFDVFAKFLDNQWQIKETHFDDRNQIWILLTKNF